MSRHDILIVDNDPLAIDVITQSLNRNGYNITVIDNGESAIQMIDACNFDLVLSELIIGASLDGLKVLRKVKEVTPHNSIIIMTSQPDRISTQDLMELDIDAFLFKPVDPDKILTCVDHCVRQTKIRYAGRDRRISDRRKSNGTSRIHYDNDRRMEDRRQFYF